MGKETGRRQVVKFSFYRVDPAWRLLPPAERQAGKEGFCHAVTAFADRLRVRAYSIIGLRGDADFLLWQIGDRLEDIQELAMELMRTPMGPFLSMPYSYLAMTRRSVYVSPQEAERHPTLHPAESRYLFVYPFVKTRAWYALPLAERQAMMDEHIAIGRRYPSVKLNTTYSFGLDDQEFVVAFETDEPADFLDLVMELRETRASAYTQRDTPIFTCIATGLREALDALGAPGETAARGGDALPGRQEVPVARLDDVPEGRSRAVYHRGDRVALFRTGGRVYALGDRCPHAGGPLSDGYVEDGCVTCPYHGSRFDLATGRPIAGPAVRPARSYRVRVRGGQVFLDDAAPGTRKVRARSAS